jgi:dihydropteroate synthase-like protein
MSEKILFLTGKLAERQLRRILSSMKPEFSYKINQIGVNVAALMSENIITRRLDKEQDADRIIVPGKFRGNLKKLSRYFNIPVERGPDDISHLPDYFGLKGPDQKLEDYECEIFAEIVDAADISIDRILSIAKQYISQGANVIDLGCMPDTKFEHLEATIKALKIKGYRVSIDSANSDELIRGANSGADYILSVSERNIGILDQVRSTPIVIPSQQGDLRSLKKTIKILQERKRDFLADPILDPIHYGFADSIFRYVKLRQDFPEIKIFMGTGNLTELTDSDSAGINATLMGLVSELSISGVLVVQVSEHCKNSIKETDIARKIMHYSKINKRLPFRIDNSLMVTSERKPTRKTKKEIREIKDLIMDKNFRIYLGENGINVFNSQIHIVGSDPYRFYEELSVDEDASHAFYLGVELARAQIAWQLGKNYDQDNELLWGVASKSKRQDLRKRPKIKSTQRKK